MQIGLLRIWTWVTISITYDDNHYTTSASINLAEEVFYWNNIFPDILDKAIYLWGLLKSSWSNQEEN